MTKTWPTRLFGAIFLVLVYAQVGLSQEIVLNIEDHSFRGDKKAKVMLIEFADYQCPYCADYFRETEPQIVHDYIKTGKVKYIFWDFPLKSHKEAFKAAEATRCAHDQGKYWEMHDRLFANQYSLGPRDLPQHAQAIGLNLQSFQSCLDNETHAAGIRNNMDEARKVGVKVTPSFFLGVVEPNNREVKVQIKLIGAEPYKSFKEAIDALLSVQK
jgi:protein-disulfide isomerase